jgi:membrane protein implicated in regulation of membrane protease activity
MADWADPSLWRWLWAVLAAGLLVGEIASAGSFLAFPFALGAFVACVLALVGAPLVVQSLVFLVVSMLGVAALRPLAKRLDRSSPISRTGSHRWVGRHAVVTEAIPGDGHGLGKVRLDSETWLAQSSLDLPLPVGSTVLVSRVDGVRLVVLPVTVPDTPELPQEGPTP